MARVHSIPEHELAICRRLRVFRESTKIARTTFAATIGYGNQRLESYETGRVPVRYHVFKAINRHFFVSLHWLVTGDGPMALNRPLDDGNLEAEISGRTLLSEVYRNVFKDRFDIIYNVAFSRYLGPGGLVENLADLETTLKYPDDRRHLPTGLLEQLATSLSHAYTSVIVEITRRKREASEPPPKKRKRA